MFMAILTAWTESLFLTQPYHTCQMRKAPASHKDDIEKDLFWRDRDYFRRKTWMICATQTKLVSLSSG
jgi:hypothetical protein